MTMKNLVHIHGLLASIRKATSERREYCKRV